MEVNDYCELEGVEEALNSPSREEALRVCYSYYTERGYPLDVVKQFTEWKTDEELFRVFHYVKKCESAPKRKNIPPFWIF